MEVIVNSEALEGAPTSLLDEAVRLALSAEGVAEAEVSLTLLDDEGMRELNREYLGRDRPTDVIAFSLGDAETLGDVYVGFERATEQAHELGIRFDEELARLAIHGTLHVLGHDHPEGAERTESPMFALQERLVRELLAGR